MKRILISVFVLYLSEQYDIYIPVDMKLMEAINLIQKSIFELSGEEYVIKDDREIVLYNEDGSLINTNNVVKYSGLKNGSRIVLV